MKKLEVNGKYQVSNEILKRKLITKYAAAIHEEQVPTLEFNVIGSSCLQQVTLRLGHKEILTLL